MSDRFIADSRTKILSLPSDQVIKPVSEVQRLTVDTSMKPYVNPNTLTYKIAKYGLDSEGNAEGTVLGFTLGGLYGQKYNKSGFPTTADGNGTISLPMSSPTFYSSISWGSLGDNYIYVILGYFKPPTTGSYTFYTSSDDGSAVWIGDAALNGGSTAADAVVNNNLGGGQGNTERSGSITLTAGEFYPIRILTSEGGGGDNLTFSWAGPSLSKTTDLSQYYYYVGDGSNFADSSAQTVGYADLSGDDAELTEYNIDPNYTLPSNINFVHRQRILSSTSHLNTVVTGFKTSVRADSKQTQYTITSDTGGTITNTRTIPSDVSGGGGTVVQSGPTQTWY